MLVKYLDRNHVSRSGRLALVLGVGLVAAVDVCSPLLAEEGTKCEPPRFEVSVEAFELAKVIAFSNADDAQDFCLYFSYLTEPRARRGQAANPPPVVPVLAAPLGGDSSSCTPAEVEIPSTAPGGNPQKLPRELAVRLKVSPGGTSAKVGFERDRVLQAGGFLGFRYESVNSGACVARASGPSDPELKVVDKHKMSFDVGSVLNLEGDGGWASQAEAAATFTSRWKPWVASGVSLRYSAIGAIGDEPEEPADPAEETSQGSSETDAQSENFDPFAAGGGTFEAGFSASFYFSKRVGVAADLGFATVPGEESSSLVAKENYFLGLRVEVEAYNSGRPAESLAGASAWFQAGLLWDNLFDDVVVAAANGEIAEIRRDESERYFLEGELEVPRVGTNWFRMLIRAKASVPRSGDGPSDVRVSVLGSIDPTKWFEGARGAAQ